jgi:hypothetical protein
MLEVTGAIILGELYVYGRDATYIINNGNIFDPTIFVSIPRTNDNTTIEIVGGSFGAERVLRSNGTPEAVVTAKIGTLFLRKDGGALTSMYIKESGISNTGWVAK